jgi:hypothetical protein
MRHSAVSQNTFSIGSKMLFLLKLTLFQKEAKTNYNTLSKGNSYNCNPFSPLSKGNSQ